MVRLRLIFAGLLLAGLALAQNVTGPVGTGVYGVRRPVVAGGGAFTWTDPYAWDAIWTMQTSNTVGILDTSGNNHTLTSAVPPMVYIGGVNQNGDTTYVRRHNVTNSSLAYINTNLTVFSGTNDYTIFAWFKTWSSASVRGALIQADFDGNHIFGLQVSDVADWVRFYTYEAAESSVVLTSTNVAAITNMSTAYHFFVGVKTGTVGSVWFDGVYITNATVKNVTAVSKIGNGSGLYGATPTYYYPVEGFIGACGMGRGAASGTQITNMWLYMNPTNYVRAE